MGNPEGLKVHSIQANVFMN